MHEKVAQASYPLTQFLSLFQLIPMTFRETMSKYLQKESNPEACFTYELAYYVETS